jgi:hypothetical protein
MPDRPTFPLDLHYQDPHPVGLDLDAIRRDGGRIRTRRRIAGTAAAAALGVGIAAGVVALRPPSAAPAPATGLDLKPIAKFLAQNPPVGEPVVLGTWPAHWTTVAWATADDRFCTGAFRIPAAGTLVDTQCTGIEGDFTADFKVDASVGMPLGMMAPAETGQTTSRPGTSRSLEPFVGVARADVARVDVTLYGQTFTADTVPLTTRDGTGIRAFQIWFALLPEGGYSSSDIQGVVAYDRDGAVVNRQTPWVMPTKPAQAS